MRFDKKINKFVEDNRLVNSGILVINNSKEISSMLLLKRKGHKHWEIPGGKVELEDRINRSKYTTLKNAALREVKEEINTNFKNLLEDTKPFFIDFTSPDNKKRRSYNFISLYNKDFKKIEKGFSDWKYIPVNKLNKFNLAPNVKILFNFIQKGKLNKFLN